MKGKEALIVTFGAISKTTKNRTARNLPAALPKGAGMCENGNEEIAYEMLWSGKALRPRRDCGARQAKAQYATLICGSMETAGFPAVFYGCAVAIRVP